MVWDVTNHFNDHPEHPLTGWMITDLGDSDGHHVPQLYTKETLGAGAYLRIWGVPAVFYVIDVSPGRNELAVPTNSTVTVTFSVPVDQQTLNDTTFIVGGQVGGRYDGAFTYNVGQREAVFTPDGEFLAGDEVTVTLTQGIQSILGESGAVSQSWTFTVEAASAPANFTWTSETPIEGFPTSVVVARLDSNSSLDIAVASWTDDSGYVTLLLGAGECPSGPQLRYPVGAMPGAICAADLNSDGFVDLATANEDSDDLSILMNDDGSGFIAHTSVEVGERPTEVVAADLNVDGHLDIIVACVGSDEVSLLFNDGTASFSDRANYSVTHLTGLCCADLDGDGDIDVATISVLPPGQDQFVSILSNQGDGTFEYGPDTYDVGFLAMSICAADFDADGDVDLATADYGESAITILFNAGDGSFDSTQQYGTVWSPEDLSAADLDGDGSFDIATVSPGADSMGVLMNDGSGDFAPYVAFACDGGPYSVFAAEINGDGMVDLATTNGDANAVGVLWNYVDGICGDFNDPPGGDGGVNIADLTFLVAYLFSGGPSPDPLCLADVNCDCGVNIADLTYLVAYMFRGGPPPCPDCCAPPWD